MNAAAIIFPPRERLLDAVTEAASVAHAPRAVLATDGRRVAWLPRLLPGWFRIAVVGIKEAVKKCKCGGDWLRHGSAPKGGQRYRCKKCGKCITVRGGRIVTNAGPRNPAGVPVEDGRDQIMVSMFKPREAETSQLRTLLPHGASSLERQE